LAAWCDGRVSSLALLLTPQRVADVAVGDVVQPSWRLIFSKLLRDGRSDCAHQRRPMQPAACPLSPSDVLSGIKMQS
jgi:hypothetical protein